MALVLRLLLVEDSPDDEMLVLAALRAAGYELRHRRVCSREAMRQALAEGPWDLIISDYFMPDFDAPGALAVAKESGSDLPFIVVSGTVGEDLAVAVMRAGARDYVMKDRLARLAPSVERELREAQERRQSRLAQEAAANARMAQERAEAMSRAKGLFLASMSHELRTPLNAIIGFAELLERGIAGPLTPRQAEYVRFMAKGGQDLLTLVNEILDLSKVEAGKMTITREPTALLSMAEGVLGTLQPLARERQVSLSHALPAGLPLLDVDPLRLKQMLYNLVSNAIKFTPRGGDVNVSAVVFPQYLEISVTDTGVGISEDDLPRLFRVFEQVAARPESRAGGTGLGLALTRMLAELHGGSITAQSELGVGSRFRLCLPTLRLDRTQHLIGGEPANDVTSSPSVAPVDILLVTSEPPSERLVSDILEHCGHQVSRADSIAEARALLARSPALVLTDTTLSDGSGELLLSEIRGHPTLNDLPVLALTGLAMLGDRERLLASGFTGYVSKPIDVSSLMSEIKSCLEARACS